MQQMMQKQIKQKKNKQYIKYEYRMGCFSVFRVASLL